MLNFFKSLKDNDNENYQNICEESKDTKINKLQYVAKNYIHISQINTIPLKNNKEIVPLLLELCPQMFDFPTKYIPNIISISVSEYNVGEDELNSTILPQEIESELKYNPDYDMLKIDLADSSLELFLKNEALPATRLLVASQQTLNSGHSSLLFDNKVHSTKLQYLYLIADQDGDSFMMDFLKQDKFIENLKVFGIKYSFSEFPQIIKHFNEIKSSSGRIPKFERLVVINQNSGLNVRD
jgi:hypothetical protein